MTKYLKIIYNFKDIYYLHAALESDLLLTAYRLYEVEL